jgi:hypothetical protein
MSRSYTSSPSSAFVACVGTALALANSYYIVSNGRVISEWLEGFRSKMPWPKLKGLSRHSSWVTGENHEQLSQNSRSPSWDLNPGPPEQEAEVLTTQPQRLMALVFNFDKATCYFDRIPWFSSVYPGDCPWNNKVHPKVTSPHMKKLARFVVLMNAG